MARNTKKAERDALHKIRKTIRRKLASHKLAKNGGINKRLKRKTHPHRRTSALR